MHKGLPGGNGGVYRQTIRPIFWAVVTTAAVAVFVPDFRPYVLVPLFVLFVVDRVAHIR